RVRQSEKRRVFVAWREFECDETLLVSLHKPICQQTVSICGNQLETRTFGRLQPPVEIFGHGQRPPDFLHWRIQIGLEDQVLVVAHWSISRSRSLRLSIRLGQKSR